MAACKRGFVKVKTYWIRQQTRQLAVLSLRGTKFEPHWKISVSSLNGSD